MMKRILSIVLTLMLMTGAAYAAPVMQSADVTAFIGEENYLYLTRADGTTSVLQVPVADLTGITATHIYAKQMDGQLIAVTKDGTGSAIVTELPADASATPRFQLENGLLYVVKADGGRLFVANNVLLAAHLPASEASPLPFQTTIPTQGTQEALYYLQQFGTTARLMTLNMEGIDQKDIAPLSQEVGLSSAAPIAMSVTKDAVTIVNGDHSVTLLHRTDASLTDASGNTTQLPAGSVSRTLAASDSTVYAFYLDGTLHTFASDSEGMYRHETAPTPLRKVSDPTQAPTVPPTIAPTATPTLKPTSKPTATPKPESESEYEDLKYGDTGSAVRAMQRRLKKLGYPVGSVDGDWGENTQLAVNLFQNAIGYKERKTATAKMQEKLFSSSAPKYDQYKALKEGKSGTPVRLMQQALYDLGWFGTSPEAIGEVDGHYGPKTAAAVMAFQQAIVDSVEDFDDSITPTGKADRATLKVLFGTMAPMAPAVQQPVPDDPLVELITPAPSGKPDDGLVEVLPPPADPDEPEDQPTDDLVEVLPPPVVDVIVPEKPDQPEDDGGVDLLVPGQ